MRKNSSVTGKPIKGTPDLIECRKTCASHAPHYEGAFCGYAPSLAGCASVCAHITCKEDVTLAQPSISTKKFVGATGQPVTWRRQSGDDSSGKILGLTTQQALIAVGVGVAAYFIIKKVK